MADIAKSGRKHSVRWYVCQTPTENCLGSKKSDGAIKVHASYLDAAGCTRKYMKSQGYIQLSSRTWTKGENDPVLIFPKHAIKSYPGKYFSITKGIYDKMPAPAYEINK